MFNKKGVTLVELLVVISVIGILIAAMAFTFTGWRAKYNIESQTKSMYMDLMNARTKAMQKNRRHFVTLTAKTQYQVAEKQYEAYEDSSPAPDGDGTLTIGSDTSVLSGTLDAMSTIIWNGGAQINFSANGLANVNKTICSAPRDRDGIQVSVDADYNCIVISDLRIKMGKLTTLIASGGTCDSTNCIIK